MRLSRGQSVIDQPMVSTSASATATAVSKPDAPRRGFRFPGKGGEMVIGSARQRTATKCGPRVNSQEKARI